MRTCMRVYGILREHYHPLESDKSTTATTVTTTKSIPLPTVMIEQGLRVRAYENFRKRDHDLLLQGITQTVGRRPQP